MMATRCGCVLGAVELGGGGAGDGGHGTGGHHGGAGATRGGRRQHGESEEDERALAQFYWSEPEDRALLEVDLRGVRGAPRGRPRGPASEAATAVSVGGAVAR